MSEHEVTEQLITFLRGRSEHGQRKYGVALNPFDGRNTTFDALEEATDLSQYLMKRVMENEVIADLLDRASDILEFFEEYYPGEVATYFHKERRPIDSGVLFETAAKLRADCERSVPVGHIPDATKKVIEYTWEQRQALADRIAIRRNGGES